jgi:hypothetical protein
MIYLNFYKNRFFSLQKTFIMDVKEIATAMYTLGRLDWASFPAKLHVPIPNIILRKLPKLISLPEQALTLFSMQICS